MGRIFNFSSKALPLGEGTAGEAPGRGVLLPLQDGGVRRPCLPPDVQAGLLTLHPLQLQLLCREGLLVDE